MTLHSSLTSSRIVSAARRNMRDCDSYIGFCVASCGGRTVYGAEELLLMVQP